ncbi:hypothetical protein [Paraferrimonas sedimenticola]|uniref:Uncharacterized protein n=1 Tax=Paraferrimonas sedimenticola TaxID=375674 RepID=A0AA37RVI1_9GAMM|nr:hypothetical protein [Paraferrimonas sedimenticola]GLP96135.1 hypothetical protein GCM10007895_14410 [Paraferrimonas sedimenticola]
MTLRPQLRFSQLALVLLGLTLAAILPAKVLAKDPSLSELVKVQKEKREAFMETFNELVEDKDFAYECRQVWHAISHVRTPQCKHAFNWRISSKIKSKDLRTYPSTPRYVDPMIQKLEKNAEFQERQASVRKVFNQMLKDHPSLTNSYNELMTANQAYQRAHVEKYGKASKFYNQ